MLRAGVDLDGCVFNLEETWLKFYNRDHDDHIKMGDMTSYDWDKGPFKCSNIYQYIYDPRSHLECPVYHKAQESLRAIMSHPEIDVTFCTSAPRTVMPAKLHRLETMFPSSRFAYGFYLTNEKHHLGCDLYVEDAPDNIHDMFYSGAHVIVFDQPWNRHLKAAGYRDSWRAAFPQYEYRIVRHNHWPSIKRLFYELVDSI